MPTGRKRIRALYGILAKRPGWHRYSAVRWIVGVVFTLSAAALPVLDVLRFDFWRGRHVVLGETVGLVAAAKAFAFPFLAVNVLIVVVSRFYGRYLCGFVCPVGSLARLGEWARFRDRKGRHKLAGPLVMLAVSALLCVITFYFWVDLRVFIEGSATAQAVSWTLLGGMTLTLFLLVQAVGLRFCRDWCPSGVYFGVLGHKTTNGIEFREDTCTHCGLCDVVCPMDLAPRDMSGGAYRGGRGLYGEAMSNFALCIRCGDCVVACVELGSAKADEHALRMGHLPLDKRDSNPPAAGEVAPAGVATGGPPVAERAHPRAAGE